MVAACVAALALLAGPMGPASAEPQGYVEAPLGVGFFYGTFDQDPNIILFAGGDFGDFCEAGPEGDPSTAPGRIYFRADGSIDLKANNREIPIHLYELSEYPGAPEWLGAACPGVLGGAAEPEPFAVGTANLKVRTSVVSQSEVHIFNSVNGKANSADGTTYKVRASADFSVIDGQLSDLPENFVHLTLREIG